MATSAVQSSEEKNIYETHFVVGNNVFQSISLYSVFVGNATEVSIFENNRQKDLMEKWKLVTIKNKKILPPGDRILFGDGKP